MLHELTKNLYGINGIEFVGLMVASSVIVYGMILMSFVISNRCLMFLKCQVSAIKNLKINTYRAAMQAISLIVHIVLFSSIFSLVCLIWWVL